MDNYNYASIRREGVMIYYRCINPLHFYKCYKIVKQRDISNKLYDYRRKDTLYGCLFLQDTKLIANCVLSFAT